MGQHGKDGRGDAGPHVPQIPQWLPKLAVPPTPGALAAAGVLTKTRDLPLAGRNARDPANLFTMQTMPDPDGFAIPGVKRPKVRTAERLRTCRSRAVKLWQSLFPWLTAAAGQFFGGGRYPTSP